MYRPLQDPTRQDRRMRLHAGSLVLVPQRGFGRVFESLVTDLHAHTALCHRLWLPEPESRTLGSKTSRHSHCRISVDIPRRIRRLV